MLVAEKMENGCGFHRTRWSAIGTIRMAAIIYAPRRRRRITRRILSIASRLVQELRRGGKSQRPTIPASLSGSLASLLGASGCRGFR